MKTLLTLAIIIISLTLKGQSTNLYNNADYKDVIIKSDTCYLMTNGLQFYIYSFKQSYNLPTNTVKRYYYSENNKIIVNVVMRKDSIIQIIKTIN